MSPFFQRNPELDENGNPIQHGPPPMPALSRPPMRRFSPDEPPPQPPEQGPPPPPMAQQGPPQLMASGPPSPPSPEPIAPPSPPQMAIGSATPPDMEMGPPTPPHQAKITTPQTDKFIADSQALQGKKPSTLQNIAGGLLSMWPATRHIDVHPGLTRDRQNLGVQQLAADEERKAQQAQSQEELKRDTLDTNAESRRASVAQRTAAQKPEAPIQYNPTKDLVVRDPSDPTGWRTARKGTPAAPKTTPARTIEGHALDIIRNEEMDEPTKQAKLQELVKANNLLHPEKPITHFETDDKGNVTAVSVNPKDVAASPGGRTQLGPIGKTKPVPAAVPSISDPALDQAATRYLKTGELPPMGMGRDAGSARTRILNRAAELDPSADIASNKGGYGADKGSLASLQKTADAINAFEGLARKNLDRFTSIAKQTIDTGQPWANRVFRGGARVLGDKNAAAFEAARITAFTEVAKVLNNPTSAAVLSDSARGEANKIMNGDYTVPQLMAVADLLKQEMGSRKEENARALGEIRTRMKGGQPTGGTSGTRPPLSSFER